MSLREASEVADLLDGEVVRVGAEAWIVLIERADGRVVALSETSVEEFADRGTFDAGHCYISISLT